MKKTIISALFLLTFLFTLVASRAFAQETEFTFAKSDIDNKNYARAITRLEQLLKDFPNYEKSKVWFYLGYSNLQLAMQNRDNPTLAKDYGQKGLVYLGYVLEQKDAQGNPKKSDPVYAMAQFYVAEVAHIQADQFLKSGKMTEAMEMFDYAKQDFAQFCQDFPNDARTPDALNRLGYIAVIERKPDEALKFFDTAIALTSSDPSVTDYSRFFRAWALGQLGSTSEAIQIFTSFVSQRSERYGAESVFEIANIYFNQGNYQQVVDRLRTFQTLFPAATTDPNPIKLVLWHDVRALLAKAYEKLGQYDQAISTITQVIREIGQPGHPAYYRLNEDSIFLFNCYFNKKDYANADGVLLDLERTVSQINSQSNIAEEVKFLRAKLCDVRGQNSETIRILGELLGVHTYTGKAVITKTPYAVPQSALTESTFFEACRLLALCYAKNDQRSYANDVGIFMGQQLDKCQYIYSTLWEQTMSEIAAGQVPSSGSTSYLAYPYTTGPVPGSPDVHFTSTTTTLPNVSSSQTGGENPIRLTDEQQKNELAMCQNLILAETRGEEVERRLKTFLENDTNSISNRVTAGLLYGNFLLTQGKTKQANDTFEMIWKDYRGTAGAAEAAYHLGMAAKEQGDNNTARDFFREAMMQQNNCYGAAMYQLACIEIYQGDAKTMAEGINRLVDIFEKHPGTKFWSHAGWLLALDSYYTKPETPQTKKKTEEILDSIIANSPDIAILDRVLFLKGKLAQDQEHWETASLSYQLLVDQMTSSPLASEASRALAECKSKLR